MSLSREIAGKDVRRSNKYNHVVNLLVHGTSDSSSSVKIFPYIKDLIIFAAMVGKKFNVKEEVDKDNTGITLSTFQGSSGGGRATTVDQHNIIFMFGLSVLRDMKYLKDENIDDVIRVFETYSNGGLNVIESWLRDSAWNPSVLLEKLVENIDDSQEGNGQVENPFT